MASPSSTALVSPRSRRPTATSMGDTESATSDVKPAKKGGAEHIKVLCRVRPFNDRELALHEEACKGKQPWDQPQLRSVVDFDGHGRCLYLDGATFAVKEKFSLDAGLWSIPEDVCPMNDGVSFTTQKDVFEDFGRGILEHAWNGFNTCFLSYGQTGAGKTFSMMGGDDEASTGLIPRIADQIFIDIDRLSAEAEALADMYTRTYRVEVSYLEIYNENVCDLLWQHSTLPPEQKAKVNPEHLRVRHHPDLGVFVDCLTSVEVKSRDELLGLIEAGNVSRHTAATKMNERSSRSHAVFKVMLSQITTAKPKKQFERPVEHIREATINLVDLAGSERNRKTGATGDRLKEAASINKSLTTLKLVIDRLVENSTSKKQTKPPYRDSSLTSLLSDSIGGNSKTIMLLCVSPHADNAEETLQTLRYGAKARKIVHQVKVNENAAGRKLLELEEQLQRMRQQVQEVHDGTAAREQRAEECKQAIDAAELREAELGRAITAAEKELEATKAGQATAALQARTRGLAAMRAMAADDSALRYHRTHAEAILAEAKKQADRVATAEATIAEMRAAALESQRQASLHHDRSVQGEAEMKSSVEDNRRARAERDAKRVLDGHQAELVRIKDARIATILRTRARCAQIRIEARRAMVAAADAHEQQMAAKQQRAEEQAAVIRQQASERVAAVSEETEELRRKAARIAAETTDVIDNRQREVARLEEVCRRQQEENSKVASGAENAVARVESEWATRQELLAADTENARVASRETLSAREEQTQQEIATIEAAIRTLMEEREAAEASAAARKAVAVAALEAEEKENVDTLRDSLEPMLLQRERALAALRGIERDDAVHAELARRIDAAEIIEAPGTHRSPAAQSFVDLLLGFSRTYKHHAPSRSVRALLLRDRSADVAATTVEAAPVVGVHSFEVQQYQQRLVEEHTAPRLRPRSPARTVPLKD